MTSGPTAKSRMPWREWRTHRRQARYEKYDAFLSYSRADLTFAAELQSGLERIAKPWHRMRSLRVFRDMSSLSPEAGLWTSIERGLERSSFFVLLLSPESASSRWVNREVAWWLENRSVESIVLVLTHGTLAWSDSAGDFDAQRSPSLAPTLLGRFSEEPSWVAATWSREAPPGDDRLQEPVVDIASRIKGIPKDELFAAAVREHRRTMRLARTGVLSLVVLLVLTAIAGVLALGQRNNARAQATLATARQLAAVSESQLSSNLPVGLVLAAASVSSDDNPQTRAALLKAALASPHLIRYVDLGSKVTALSGSGDGRVMVAGLADGRVMRWTTTDSRPDEVLELTKEIKQLAVDERGETVAASSGDGFALTENTTAELWRKGQGTHRIEVPDGQLAGSVGVSPSGDTVLVHGAAIASGGAASISRLDGATGEVEEVFPFDDDSGTAPTLIVPSDEEAVLYDGGYGSYDHRDLDDWSSSVKGGVLFGAHEASGWPAADGGFITATNGAQEVPVWPTTGGGRPDEPPLTAQVPISGPGALALSPDGSHLAIADTGRIYVAEVRPAGERRPAPVELTGNGSVDLVRFLGDDDHLISASGSRVALWDTLLLDRLAHSMRVPVGTGCSACGGARISVSADGTRAAITGGSGDGAAMQDLRTGKGLALPDTDLDFSYGAPVWNAGGSAAAIPVIPSAGGSEAESPAGLPRDVRSWRLGAGEETVLASGPSRAGDAVVAVTDRGTIHTQSVADGTTERTVEGLSELSMGGDSLKAAAVASGRDIVATLLDDTVRVVDAGSGKVLHRFSSRGATWLAFGGDRLFVQHDDGSLQVRSGLGARAERTVPGDASLVWPPVPDPQGSLVARQRQNSEIVLVDVATGQTLATIPPNPDSTGSKVGVAFTPDGKRLITVTDETEYQAGAILVDRDLSRASLLRSVCATAGRPLTRDEWRRFVGTDPPHLAPCR